MDETTQQNAAMAEESNAASHSLSQETSQLANLVEQFQVEGRDGATLKRELRKVAPHAFAKPEAAAESMSINVTKQNLSSTNFGSGPPARAVAGGSAARDGGWIEF
jgi:methyl-accepting chemotaxis protein